MLAAIGPSWVGVGKKKAPGFPSLPPLPSAPPHTPPQRIPLRMAIQQLTWQLHLAPLH
jgi:hypothetical protein